MRSFKELERFRLDRGLVISVALDQDEPRTWLLHKLRQEGGVEINGVKYHVKDVESFAVDPLQKGSTIGLLVEEDRSINSSSAHSRFTVDWQRYSPGIRISHGDYWLVLKYDDVPPYVVLGERVYSKPQDIFRTDDVGGCDEWVTWYAPFVRPELP